MKVTRAMFGIMMSVAIGFVMSFSLSFLMLVLNAGLIPGFLLIWMKGFALSFAVSIPIALIAIPLIEKTLLSLFPIKPPQNKGTDMKNTLNDDANSKLIAVVGCTGRVGSQVMRELAFQNCHIRGILSQPGATYPVPSQDHPMRISYVAADGLFPDQLKQAFKGVDALFLAMVNSLQQVEIESNVIDAADQAGIRRIIKLSTPFVAPPASVVISNWHRDIEAKLATSGMEHCSIRPVAFMQTWLRHTHVITHFGKIIGAAGSASKTYVDCRDIAAVAVKLLLSEHPLPSEFVTLTGNELINYQEMAERLSRATGSKIIYENIPPQALYQFLMTEANMPDWLARHLVQMEEFAALIPEKPNNSVQEFLGCYPRTMDEFVQEHRMAFMVNSINGRQKPTQQVTKEKV